MPILKYLVVDVRVEWRAEARHPFITFWGPENRGYFYSLEHAGRYTVEELQPGYHEKKNWPSNGLLRFAVQENIVLQLAHGVPADLISRYPDLGRVVMNNATMRGLLRKARFRFPKTELRLEAP